jgi:GT2 family glycosyltransferase
LIVGSPGRDGLASLCYRCDLFGDTEMDISVIVVTWNSKRFVEECFGSIRKEIGSLCSAGVSPASLTPAAATAPAPVNGEAGDDVPLAVDGKAAGTAALQRQLSAEVIAVDNGSSDGTADLIAERFPEVILVRSATNLGFAMANVIAIERSEGKYVCLVNPDASVLPGCFQKIMDHMEVNPTIGVLGPKMLNPDGSMQPSCFRAPSVWNSWCRALALDQTGLRRLALFGGPLMADFAHDRTRDVDALNGCFLLVRRTAMDQAGLIDADYFMYGDDIDWCLQFRKAGWRVVFYPEAEAVHYGGGTSARAPVACYVEKQKANLQYWEKHHSRPAQMAYLASMWVHDFTRYLAYSIASLLGEPWRDRVGLKAQRSLANLRWLRNR